MAVKSCHFYQPIAFAKSVPCGQKLCLHLGLVSLPAAAASYSPNTGVLNQHLGISGPGRGGQPGFQSSQPQLGHRNSSSTFPRKSAHGLLILKSKRLAVKYLGCTTGLVPFLKGGHWQVFLPFKQFRLHLGYECSDPKLTRGQSGPKDVLNTHHRINQVPALEFFLPLTSHIAAHL